ncbi:DUF3631 domain-containing protein [Plantactinospora solaniradicis]|uniref:DUF3631 domain-containing protein n=1 Tax=Plantactinospora solaniradicis TaxID=1723736 RepID=A0ABW1K7R3_9ACTN
MTFNPYPPGDPLHDAYGRGGQLPPPKAEAVADRSTSEGGTVGAALLDELRAALVRYVILPTDQTTDAVTCYIAATYGVSAWEHATRLMILSPEKRCGKSRLLDIIEATCHRPLITVNISPAALVRSLGDKPPTLLLDEADTVFGKKAADNNEDLRGILNAGHQRSRPYIRWDAAARALESCPTFSMAVLAGIGDMPDTIMDRSVIARMRRRAAHEKVAPYRRRRDEPGLRDIGNRVGAWVREHLAELAEAVPEMPVEDRAADTWEPLVAIADLAGGDWPRRIRAACESMVGEADADGAEATLARRLLADLRDVFGDAQNLYTTTVLDRLHKIEDGPWANYFGRLITSNDLAKLLRDYRVKPADVREPGGANRKGYRRDDLHDAWNRYLPRDSRDTSDLAAQSRRGDESDSATSRDTATAATPLTCEVTSVAPVAGVCPVCGFPVDPAAGDTHPGCGP